MLPDAIACRRKTIGRASHPRLHLVRIKLVQELFASIIGIHDIEHELLGLQHPRQSSPDECSGILRRSEDSHPGVFRATHIKLLGVIHSTAELLLSLQPISFMLETESLSTFIPSRESIQPPHRWDGS